MEATAPTVVVERAASLQTAQPVSAAEPNKMAEEVHVTIHRPQSNSQPSRTGRPGPANLDQFMKPLLEEQRVFQLQFQQKLALMQQQQLNQTVPVAASQKLPALSDPEMSRRAAAAAAAALMVHLSPASQVKYTDIFPPTPTRKPRVVCFLPGPRCLPCRLYLGRGEWKGK